jgi:hypothetical protein
LLALASDEMERMWKKVIVAWPTYPSICLRWRRKTTLNPGQGTWYLSRESNRPPLEYKLEALPLKATCTLDCSIQCWENTYCKKLSDPPAGRMSTNWHGHVRLCRRTVLPYATPFHYCFIVFIDKITENYTF